MMRTLFLIRLSYPSPCFERSTSLKIEDKIQVQGIYLYDSGTVDASVIPGPPRNQEESCSIHIGMFAHQQLVYDIPGSSFCA